MIKTEIQDTLGESRNAYCLLALLSDDTKHNLAGLLDKLQHDLGDAVWVMPLESLHITLCEVIQSKDYSDDKDTLYRAHASEYEGLPSRILENYRQFTVTFDTLEVSPQAIIIKGRDDGSFAAIRKQLVDTLPLPPETKLPPTIIHSTIARFRKQVPIDKVKEIVAENSVLISEIVSEFKLIQLRVTPLLDYDTIRTYRLLDSSNFIH